MTSNNAAMARRFMRKLEPIAALMGPTLRETYDDEGNSWHSHFYIQHDPAVIAELKQRFRVWHAKRTKRQSKHMTTVNIAFADLCERIRGISLQYSESVFPRGAWNLVAEKCIGVRMSSHTARLGSFTKTRRLSDAQQCCIGQTVDARSHDH